MKISLQLFNSFVAVKSNPIISARFNVVFSNNQFADGAGFDRVSGLESSVDVVEYREGGQEMTTRKLPGITRFSPVTFEQGVTNNMDMYNWARKAFIMSPDDTPGTDTYDGDTFRRNLIINALDSDFVTIVRSWEIIAAWPSSVRIGDFDAQSSAVLIQSMTVQNEGIIPYGGPAGTGSGTAGAPTAADFGVSYSGPLGTVPGLSGPGSIVS